MTTVWLLHDYGEGGDHSDVEGVYATREAAVRGVEKIVAESRSTNAKFDPERSVTLEWEAEDSPVIYDDHPTDGGGAWYFLITENEVEG